MATEITHEIALSEISAAHDEMRPLDPDVSAHLTECDQCLIFRESLEDLDTMLGVGRFEEAPDLTEGVMEDLSPRRIGWWAVAAITLVGITVGALVGGIATRIEQVHAEDLSALFHRASPNLTGLSADLVVVERGWHPDVPERVYAGSLAYLAPESLAVRLVDTTSYPDDEWIPNDVELTVSDGDLVSLGSARCPLPAIPSCLIQPRLAAMAGLKPFDDGILSPLELVGPGRSLNWWSGLEVLGTPTLEGSPTIQVATTVAAVELIRAITDVGAWRELHPTDPVLMWLDEKTLTPLRVEVRAADSPERSLWQLRRGYFDQPGEDPILIISLSNLEEGPERIEVDLPVDPVSAGFVDGEATGPEPTLEPGFEPHRNGHWTLPEGGRVDVATWSDGRSWVMVESTTDWAQPRLFGSSFPFARPVDLGGGSIGYLNPAGDAIAIHTDVVDVLVTGSLAEGRLLAVATSLGLIGIPVPEQWVEAAVVDIDDLSPGTLIPTVDGWSLAGATREGVRTILMTGGGARTVLITQEPGTALDPPIGPDFVAVQLRDTTGRYDIAAATLEWVEEGHVLGLRSDTVGMGELVSIAETMVSR